MSFQAYAESFGKFLKAIGVDKICRRKDFQAIMYEIVNNDKHIFRHLRSIYAELIKIWNKMSL